MIVSAPVPIADHHDRDRFDSGRPLLDDWLRRRALANQASGATRTFVATTNDRVVGYYALAAGAVKTPEAPGRFRRNMPDPIPVVVLARLAVDRSVQGSGVGRALVRDAVLRTLGAADVIGIRGLLVHALDEEARGFYARLGFDASPLDPMTLMIRLADAGA